MMWLISWTLDLHDLQLLFPDGVIPASICLFVSGIWLEFPDLEMQQGSLQNVMS